MMRNLFPHQKAIGIDLGNVELKECSSKCRKFSIKPEDKRAEYIIFYNHWDQEFLFMNVQEWEHLISNKRRSFSIDQVRKLSFLTTTDIEVFYAKSEEIIRDKTHCGWLPCHKTHVTENMEKEAIPVGRN